MFVQPHHEQAAFPMEHGDAGLCRELAGWGELQRWGSGTSTSSSNDWNDIGLPPLPRQRSTSTPSWGTHLDRAAQAQHQQLAMSTSVPLPEEYAVHEYSLQGCLSVPEEGLQFPGNASPRTRHGSSPHSCLPTDYDSCCDDTSQVWESISPATALALARTRRPHKASIHSSTSMASTISTCSSSSSSSHSHSHSQPLPHVHSSRSSGSSSPMAVDYGSGSSSAVCLPRLGSPKPAEVAQARLNPQEQLLLSKLKNIMNGKEQLGNIEKQLRHQLDEEAIKAPSTSPRGAAQATALKTAPQPRRCSSMSSSSRSSPVVQRHGHHAPTAPAAGSPYRQCNSTAAALLAAHADPALVAEYLCAHKQQQQQHQAVMAAVAAAAAAAPGSSPRSTAQGRHAAKAPGGLNPAAMTKLRQLMALQQQQILIQQELLSMLHQA